MYEMQQYKIYCSRAAKVISEGRKYENEKGEKERIHNEGAEEGHISLAVLCPGCCIDIYIQLHTYVWCPAGIPAIQCQGGYMGKPWVGLYYFKRFFESPYFASTIKNTLILSLYGLVVSFPIPIILALLLNSFRHKRYRKVIQTVTYAPNFISTVVMCGMIILFLSPSVGVINNVVRFFGGDPVNFMAKKEYWRHIYVWTGVWQGMGWNSVIYFAALFRNQPGAA